MWRWRHAVQELRSKIITRIVADQHTQYTQPRSRHTHSLSDLQLRGGNC